MKKAFSIILTLALCLSATGCGGSPDSSSGIVSGSGTVEFTSSQSQGSLPPVPESPAAVESSSSQPASQPEAPVVEDDSVTAAAKAPSREVRSVWISYLELETMMSGESGKHFRETLGSALDECAEFGLNTVVFHVRPFGDAVYKSSYFPQSYLFTGAEGGVNQAPFDALQIAIEEAHKRDLRLEAWINPYRVRHKAGRALGEDNPVHSMLESGDAVKMGDVITYDPASKKAQQLIINGVKEIVENYEVDAIHFDDYFYPTTDTEFDAESYAGYLSAGGSMELAAWRRSNVTALVGGVHDAIKSIRPSVQFGISPQGNMSNNLNSQFVDVEEIVSKGLVDYICPQMYFGFKNSGCPYLSTLEDFNEFCSNSGVKLYVGLATYKFNKVDSWAGEGKNEWVGTTDIIKRQVEAARELFNYGGFVLFRYDSSFAPDQFYYNDGVGRSQAKTEMNNLKMLL